jgi:hypothetical protein
MDEIKIFIEKLINYDLNDALNVGLKNKFDDISKKYLFYLQDFISLYRDLNNLVPPDLFKNSYVSILNGYENVISCLFYIYDRFNEISKDPNKFMNNNQLDLNLKCNIIMNSDVISKELSLFGHHRKTDFKGIKDRVKCFSEFIEPYKTEYLGKLDQLSNNRDNLEKKDTSIQEFLEISKKALKQIEIMLDNIHSFISECSKTISVGGKDEIEIISSIYKDYMEKFYFIYKDYSNISPPKEFVKTYNEYLNNHLRIQCFNFLKVYILLINIDEKSHNKKIPWTIHLNNDIFKQEFNNITPIIQKRKRSQYLHQAINSRFLNLSPRDFEILIKDLFEAMGYTVELTNYQGDMGADLIVTKDNDRIIVEAKRYNPRNNVGNEVVRSILGALWKLKANKAVVVTSSDFTLSAKSQAKGPIELWDYDILCNMIEKYLIIRDEEWDIFWNQPRKSKYEII